MSILVEAYQVHLNDKSRDHTSPNLLENLVLAEVLKPVPGPGEVLVRIHAAALNFRDLFVLASSPIYPFSTSPDLVPGADGAGIIEELGEQSKWSVGDEVVFVTNCDWLEGDDPSQYTVSKTLGGGTENGTLRQYAVVKDEGLVKKPNNLTFQEAAAIGAVGATAVHALGTVKKGMTVLTQGTGGVSCISIQIASALGARVIATSSSDEKLEIARALGASDLINYKTTPEWSSEVLRLTNGKGVDLVIDVGGAGTINQSILSTKTGGSISMVGFLASDNTPTAADIIKQLIFGAKTLRGILGQSRVHLQRTIEIFEKYDLHPHIGTPYEWKNASDAIEALRKGAFIGKLVVKV